MEVRPEGRLRSDVWSRERGTYYLLVAFDIDPQSEHKDFVDRIIDEASQHSANIQNPGGRNRNSVVLSKTRYLGALAEDLIANHLQSIFGQRTRVFNRTFERHDIHVDIEIEIGGRKIDSEVRSSFGYARLHNLIDKYFDHIGPYTTSYKSNEKPKHFYLRGLINEHPNNFSYDREHTFYFAGGVPYRLLEQMDRHKDFDQPGADYLVVPLYMGMDAVEIIELLKGTLDAV